MKVTAENNAIKIVLNVAIIIKDAKKLPIDPKEKVLNVIGKMFIDQDFGVRQIKYEDKS